MLGVWVGIGRSWVHRGIVSEQVVQHERRHHEKRRRGRQEEDGRTPAPRVSVLAPNSGMATTKPTPANRRVPPAPVTKAVPANGPARCR